MLRAHCKIIEGMTEPHLETVVAALMFWSDATHLANFGTASLWPLYLFFGNHSKFLRGKPTARAGYHQAYFPSVPDSVKDAYQKKFGVAMPPEVLTHVKRELIHAVWSQLLFTADFIHAYLHGIEITCWDKILRLIFPRLLTYSADYPEKVLLATIKSLGGCPCHRCFIPKDKIHDLGTKADVKRRQNVRQDVPHWRSIVNIARDFIYRLGRKVTGTNVDALLKAKSWVPTRNAFSKIKDEADPEFDIFKVLVPDVLHEVELGVVKAAFTHMVRVLDATTKQTAEMDSRFRRVPSFGPATIRRFYGNVSDMKQFAARTYEDVLQCLAPVIDGLFSDDRFDLDGLMLDYTWDLATYHAYSKMRLHTTSTLERMEVAKVELGKSARRFAFRTSKIKTVETEKEYKARIRRIAKDKARKSDSREAGPVDRMVKLEKEFNLNTPKFHYLGDYPDAIVETGPLDGTSTQIGELAHVTAKQLYGRTNRRAADAQIATHEHRTRIVLDTERRMDEEERRSHLPAAEDDPLPPLSPDKHHQISASQKTHWTLGRFKLLPGMDDDPAYENFVPKLRAHLRRRLLGHPYAGPDSPDRYHRQELNDVLIDKDRIYTHALMHLNYTNYAMRRDQDVVSPRTHPNIMVLSHEDGPHPYSYGHVLAIFHVWVRLRDGQQQRVEVLWIRWYRFDTKYRSGWRHKRLHRVEFVDHEEPDAFSFLDPQDVIRAVHLVPQFRMGRHSDALPRSIARSYDVADDDDADWAYYNINWFVDRDMVMRYHADAVGHQLAVPPADDVQAEVEDGEEDEPEMDVDALTIAQILALPDEDGEDDLMGLLEEEERQREDEEAEAEEEGGNAAQRQPNVLLRGDEALYDAADQSEF
uniref:Uncharacterized protein n=1 Tax=Mycena chlorophos TaxID=658473 RepID=A0ABQ0L6A7_MYCCL|nr:predicted protein [Mycena chlorophos]